MFFNVYFTFNILELVALLVSECGFVQLIVSKHDVSAKV